MTEAQENDLIELRQGSYWRSREAITIPGLAFSYDYDEERDERDWAMVTIPVGQVLLLQSIRDVDNTAHTIIIRPHPSVYGTTVYEAVKYEGETICSWKHEPLDEYRFLVQDFMTKFDLVADPEPIRAAELGEAQEHIRRLQQKLRNGQSNPDVLRPVLEAGIKEWEEEKKLDPQQAEYIATMATTTELVPTLTEGHVDNLKLRIEREHKLATVRADWIKERVEEIGEAVQAIMPYMEEQAAAALSHTEDVIRKVGNIQKGIESLDLYIGKDVIVETLKTGESAPAGVPLTIAQRKLFMQEEFSVWADISEDFDYHSEDAFLKALCANESLRNQVFPGNRVIVCMATRRNDKDYRDPWANYGKNKINKEVFLLIRDGENIHRVFSPVESHLRALHLFPSRNEVNGIFSGADGSNINFTDVRYTDKLEEHEAVALHYKRFLILLAGLDHRLNLFGPFYEGPKTTKFVSLAFQQEHFRFVHDADGEGMLPLPSRPSLHEWLKTNNAYLRSGSRVMCLWDVLANPRTAPGMTKNNEKERHGYYNSRHPQQRHEVAIVSESKGELVVHCATKGSYWRNDNNKVLQTRVSLSAWTENYYKSGLGYIVLDAVKADELDWYIHDRDSRIHHLDYIILFKETLAYLREVEKQEAPARKALREALEAGNIGDPDRHDELVDTAVRGWRADTRGAVLPSETSGKTWTTLLDTMYTISAGPALNRKCRKFVAELGHEGAQPLRFIVTGANKLALYIAPTPEQRDDRLTPHIWVRKFYLDWKKNGDLKLAREQWTILPAAQAAETTIFEWPEAAEWAGKKSPFPNFEEKQHLFALVDQSPVLDSPWLKEKVTPEEWEEMYTGWSVAYTRNNRNQSYAKDAPILFPIGLSLHLDKNTVHLIMVKDTTPVVRLWDLAHTDADRKKVEECYGSIWYPRSRGAARLKELRQTSGRKVSLVTTAIEDRFPHEDFEFSAVGVLRPGTHHSSSQKKEESLDWRYRCALDYLAMYKTRHYSGDRVPEPFMTFYRGAGLQDRSLDSLFEHYCDEFVGPDEPETTKEEEGDDE